MTSQTRPYKELRKDEYIVSVEQFESPLGASVGGVGAGFRFTLNTTRKIEIVCDEVNKPNPRRFDAPMGHQIVNLEFDTKTPSLLIQPAVQKCVKEEELAGQYSYVVNGAGEEEVNGTYHALAQSDGNPRYLNEHGISLHRARAPLLPNSVGTCSNDAKQIPTVR